MLSENRIFLAHAREDKPRVRDLYDRLKESGFNPWLDGIDLFPGQIWKVEIPKAIRGASVFLACLSHRSVGKVGYVQDEFRRALAAFSERPAGSIYLIPVRLDECDVPDLQIPDIGRSLQDFQCADLFEENGFKYLVSAVQMALADDSDFKSEVLPPIVSDAPDTSKGTAEPAHKLGANSSLRLTGAHPDTTNPGLASFALVDSGQVSPPGEPVSVFLELDISRGFDDVTSGTDENSHDSYEWGFTHLRLRSCFPKDLGIRIDNRLGRPDPVAIREASLEGRGTSYEPYWEISAATSNGLLDGEYVTNDAPLFELQLSEAPIEFSAELFVRIKNVKMREEKGKKCPTKNKKAIIERLISDQLDGQSHEDGWVKLGQQVLFVGKAGQD